LSAKAFVSGAVDEKMYTIVEHIKNFRDVIGRKKQVITCRAFNGAFSCTCFIFWLEGNMIEKNHPSYEMRQIQHSIR